MSPDPGTPPPAGPNVRDVLYPSAYVWLVLVSSLDIMVTWAILTMGGRELNPVAASVIELFNVSGMVAFKFALIIVFLLACEFVGRRRPRTGRTMAYVAVGLSAAPVALGLFLLAAEMWSPGEF